MRLRVGVDRRLVETSPGTGHGGAWAGLLSALAERDDTEVVVDDPRRRLRPPPVDVWFTDGHAAPDPRRRGAPRVPMVYDVRWADPIERPHLALAFDAQVIPRTDAAVADASRIVAPSHHAAGAITAHYGLAPGTVHTVPLGTSKRPDSVGSTIGLGPDVPPGLPYVVFVGTVEHRKHLGELRRAVGLLARSPHPLRLVVRADPAPGQDSRQLLDDAVAPLGTGVPAVDEVVALPRLDRDRLDRVVREAMALCTPSTYEGYGLPVLEAMALGTPVVVADRTSLRELVGDTGLLVEPTDGALADALAALAASLELRTELAAAGRRAAAQRTWAAAAASCREALGAAVGAPTTSAGRVRLRRPDLGPPSPAAITCPVCHRSNGTPVAAFDGWVTCPCGVVRATTALDPADRLDDGRSRTRPPGWPAWLTEPTTFDELAGAVAAQRLELVEEVLGSARRRRLVDARSDVGHLVDAARHRGWQAHGWEPVPEVAERARRRGLDVRTGTWAGAEVEESDVLVLANVVEAAQDVPRLLDRAASTVPHGAVHLEVPNWSSPARRRDGDDWHHHRPLDSTVHFSRRSLVSILRAHGWSIEWSGTRTWRDADRNVAVRVLVPWRSFLLRGAAVDDPRRRSVRVRLVDLLLAAYDRVGLGDVVVVIARPPQPGATAPPPRRRGRFRPAG